MRAQLAAKEASAAKDVSSFVATVLAHRLDGANQALIQLKNQLQTGEAYSVVTKTVSRMEGLLAVGDDFLDD